MNKITEKNRNKYLENCKVENYDINNIIISFGILNNGVKSSDSNLFLYFGINLALFLRNDNNNILFIVFAKTKKGNPNLIPSSLSFSKSIIRNWTNRLEFKNSIDFSIIYKQMQNYIHQLNKIKGEDIFGWNIKVN